MLKLDAIFTFIRNSELSFSEKAQILLRPFQRDALLHKQLLKRLAVDSDFGDYFRIQGMKLFFKPDFPVVNQEYFLRGITQIIKETFILPDHFCPQATIHAGDVVLDIGAAIGTTALIFSHLAGEKGRVIAFEPVMAGVLRTNVRANNLNNVEVVEKGVADKCGVTEIEISDYGVDASICRRNYTRGYYQNTRSINLISLDEFIRLNPLPKIDFIKMDIEGAEESALRGAETLIKKYRPKWSIASYHIDSENQPQHDKLVSLLKQFDYHILEHKNQRIYAY